MKTNPALLLDFGFRASFVPARRDHSSFVILPCRFLFCVLLSAFCFLRPTLAATTNLATTLQQALFEEEANHNLNAAIQSYQALVGQFDQDRKLAATAVFRLGECFRKQGNTNDATVQYERIIRDFSDQSTLLTLSRQNLAALSGNANAAGAGRGAATAARDAELMGLENQIAELKRLPKEKRRVAVQQSGPNSVLNGLMEQLGIAEQRLASVQLEFGPEHTEVQKAKVIVETVSKQIDAQVEGALIALEARRDALAKAALQDPNSMHTSTAAREEQKRLLEEEIKLVEKQLASQQKQVDSGRLAPDEMLPVRRDLLKLRRQLAALDAGQSPSDLALDSNGAPTSAEAEEVKRIQALIKDSPDLINSSGAGQTLLQSAAGKGQLTIVKLLLENGAAVDGVREHVATPLQYASANGHKAVVDLLLSKGAKAAASDDSGITALHLAAGQGYEAVAKVLLAAGAQINARITAPSSYPFNIGLETGQTPLHAAVKGGYSSVVQLLLDKGAEPNAEDDGGRTPLSYAADKGDFKSSMTLLKAHANPNASRRDPPLLRAAHNGDVAILELLLASGADPNTNGFTGWGDGKSKYSPLAMAVMYRHPEAIKTLIHYKADPNVPDSQGKPVLFDALQNIEALKALLDGGANPNLTATDGFTPLARAVHNNNRPAVEALLAHHANPNAKIEVSYGEGGKGYTPLLIATARVIPELVDVLLAAEADPNLRSDSRAPILNALNNENPAGRKQMVTALLDHDAKPDARDTDGKTALMYAVVRSDKETAALLLAHKADVNAASKDGATPLHLAVAYNHPDLVELLLANKADPNARNNSGETPLDLAKRAASQPGQPGGYPGSPPLSYQWTTPGMPGIPQPSSSASFATRLAQIQNKPTPANPEADSPPPSIADLLRQHGAADELPDFSVIRVMRKGMGPWLVFKRDTNSLNRFSLLETLAGAAHLNLQFPAFTQIKIHRPDPAKPGAQKELAVNPTITPTAFDCAKDLPLEFGDVVEIPEREHALTEAANYLPSGALWDTIRKCLTRNVKFAVRDQTVVISLGGYNSDSYLSSALQRQEVQNILRSSSDFSHVHIKRTDPETKKVSEFTADVQAIWAGKTSRGDDLWLRDGDVIEVPDKTE